MSKRFALSLIIDVAMTGLAIAWLFGGSSGAGSVFQVVFWVVQPLALLGVFSIDLSVFEKRSPGELALFYVYGIGMAVLLAWFGHTSMAAVLVVKLLLFSARMEERTDADKTVR